jgi:hypothetical protein
VYTIQGCKIVYIQCKTLSWENELDHGCRNGLNPPFAPRPKPVPKPKPKPLESIPDEPRKMSDPAVKPLIRRLPTRKLSEVLPLTAQQT